MNDDKPLTGKTILITRAEHQAGDFVNLIIQRGGTPVVFPTIQILPPDSWDSCDRALQGLYMYDGIIFTSSNGVDCFFRRCTEKSIPKADLQSKQVFVVGEKTKQATEKAGLSVAMMPEKFTASDLSRQLEQQDLHGKTFLFPRGNLGSNVLADNLKLLGAGVDSVIVYKTEKPNTEHIDKIRLLLEQKKIDVLSFTSSSTFNNFTALFSKQEMETFCTTARIAVIGPVTAKTVESFGLNVDIIPSVSTTSALVEAIEEFFQSNR